MTQRFMFRCWQKSTKKMINNVNLYDYINNDDYIIMQSTDIEIDSGIIYEGDIIQDKKTQKYFCVRYRLGSLHLWSCPCEGHFTALELGGCQARLEIVGNIYENPDLLEKM